MARRRINNSESRRKERRARAEARWVEREKRTDREQLERLDKAFGVGCGAQKERARLQRRIERQS